MPEAEISAILTTLERYRGQYEQEAVDAATAHREEITPFLIDCLEKVADNPTWYLEDRDYYLYVFAVMLLGHWRETRGHAAIIKVFSLPTPVLDEFFGDIVTEHLTTILYNTCGGDFQAIKSLVLNPRADAFVRWAAAQALNYAVAAGDMSREEALNFFSTLFTGYEAAPPSPFWGQMSCCIRDLYPEELMPIIKEAWDKGLLGDGFFVAKEDFSEALAGSVEQSLAKLREELEMSSLDDLHRVMSRWSSPDLEEPAWYPFLESPESKPKDTKKKKKSKKKQAKTSRRKNRR